MSNLRDRTLAKWIAVDRYNNRSDINMHTELLDEHLDQEFYRLIPDMVERYGVENVIAMFSGAIGDAFAEDLLADAAFLYAKGEN